MFFLEHLWPKGSVAAGLATLSLAVALGLALGAIRIRGLKLGVSGVLFSALLFGQLGMGTDTQVLSFLRDFSLILFVYTIGLQVGPGFVDSLRSDGLVANLLAIAVLVLGGVIAATLIIVTRLDQPNQAGLYAGAFTTTPGLAAGQDALQSILRSDPPSATAAIRLAGLAYAVTYPFGTLGPVLMIAFFRWLFRVNVPDELKTFEAARIARRPLWGSQDFQVANSDLDGKEIRQLDFTREHGIIFSRVLHDGVVSVPNAQTKIVLGDVVRAVGPEHVLQTLPDLIGPKSRINLETFSDRIGRLELIVTRTAVLRKTLRELDLINRIGVTLSRVTRSGVDIPPNGSLTLHFGDVVTAVGPPEGLKAAEVELGNSPADLNRPQLMPIFVGIVLGILVGSIPIAVPGLKGGIRLGLASGPLLVAIVLSRLGNIGSVVWYMPATVNSFLRDFGLAVFLACVGLQQGDHFVQKLLSGNGLEMVALGFIVTVLPLLLGGMAARWIFKMNFITLSGWAAGAMTSSPALLYAVEITQSDAPALAYAAVAPLAMIVPIICCQVLATIR